jgi:hypothetical protein
MTIFRKTTEQDDIREFSTYLKEYKVKVKKEIGCTVLYIYERRFFSQCLAYINLSRNTCLCNNEKFALQLDMKYSWLNISLVSPENRIA